MVIKVNSLIINMKSGGLKTLKLYRDYSGSSGIFSLDVCKILNLKWDFSKIIINSISFIKKYIGN